MTTRRLIMYFALSLLAAGAFFLLPFDPAAAQTTGESSQTGEMSGPGAAPGAQTDADDPSGIGGGQAAQTVEQATLVFRDIMDAPRQNIPPEILDKAVAVAVIPNLVKVGFIAAGRHGTGVLLKQQNQGWSPPIFMSISGASIGAQLGVQSSDVVLVFNKPENLQTIMQGNDFTLGVDASIAAGPAGATARATTSDADIFAYKRTEGLFAGVSLSGGVITLNQDLTMAYYPVTPQELQGGDRDRMMQAILSGGGETPGLVEQVPPSARQLQDVLARYTSSGKAQAQAPTQAETAPEMARQQADTGQGAQAAAPSGSTGRAARLYISPVSLAAIQDKLKEQGSDISQVDGRWGPATARAVRSFQQNNGLNPTGNLNLETIQALGVPQVLKGAVERTGLLMPGQLPSDEGAPLFISPASLQRIQEQLRQQGFDPGAIDGALGSATREAIRRYEASQDLPATGTVTVQLIQSLGLDQMIAELVGVGEPEVVAQDRDLRIFEQDNNGQRAAADQRPEQQEEPARGYQDPQQQQAQERTAGTAPAGQSGRGEGAQLHVGPETVQRLQQSLQRQGYDPGPTDGIWGAQTSQAVKRFQEARSLEPTGKLNLTTARILLGDFEAQSQPQPPQQQPQ